MLATKCLITNSTCQTIAAHSWITFQWIQIGKSEFFSWLITSFLFFFSAKMKAFLPLVVWIVLTSSVVSIRIKILFFFLSAFSLLWHMITLTSVNNHYRAKSEYRQWKKKLLKNKSCAMPSSWIDTVDRKKHVGKKLVHDLHQSMCSVSWINGKVKMLGEKKMSSNDSCIGTVHMILNSNCGHSGM